MHTQLYILKGHDAMNVNLWLKSDILDKKKKKKKKRKTMMMTYSAIMRKVFKVGLLSDQEKFFTL